MSDCRTLDPLVTPYVDGELPDADRRAIDAHLAQCPPCASRIAAERAVRETLDARRREIAGDAAPPALRAACSRLCSQHAGAARRTSQDALSTSHDAPRTSHDAPRISPNAPRAALRWLAPFALAASLVLLVGGAFVYQLTDRSATVMAAELVADHTKCFALNALLGTHQAPSAVEAAMLGGFGWNVHLPANPAQAGLELVGARPCLYGEGTIAHLMYRHDGHPVSLFMLPKSTRTDQLVEVLGHQAKIWCIGNRTLVLIAREPRRDVERLAEYMQASLH
ncbi:MAG TPA: zf-HC2 domain-containing protein [Vicinamibacterales bacterium]|nr:zf-HC2 domain-containing protein [Vicinamibacterales bacterium]